MKKAHTILLPGEVQDNVGFIFSFPTHQLYVEINYKLPLIFESIF